MKTRRYIAAFVLCALSLCTWSQDYVRLGERSIMGTARYVGMGGAMSAIGGDPSAARDNAAGLGLYRRSEVLFTIDEAIDRTQAQGNSYVAYRNVVSIPQASVVISLPSYRNSDEGIQFNNILFSYNRLCTFGRNIYAYRQTPASSLGDLIASYGAAMDIDYCASPKNGSSSLQLNESGQVHEFAIQWAMNISNRWFVGAGMQFQSARFASDASYSEVFPLINDNRQNLANRNNSSLILTSATVAGSVGLIYRPTGWMRLGFGLQTASIGAVNTYTSGEFVALTDSTRTSYAPNANYSSSDFHMPWHISTSAAFQIGAYGLIALQYDYLHQRNETDIHSLRAGFEVIPVLGFYINAGYVYESSFKNDTRVVPMDPEFVRQDTYFQHPVGAHYASIALGYRGTHMLAQLAYQYRHQHIKLWPLETADPFDINADTHRIVLTIGWHRNY